MQKLKDENAALVEEYGYCNMDGHKEKIANFRIEPPGLFRGRGSHPKMGVLKRRVRPEDIIINCSKYVASSYMCNTRSIGKFVRSMTYGCSLAGIRNGRSRPRATAGRRFGTTTRCVSSNLCTEKKNPI